MAKKSTTAKPEPEKPKEEPKTPDPAEESTEENAEEAEAEPAENAEEKEDEEPGEPGKPKEEKEKEKVKKTTSSKDKVDPTIVDFANYLKEQMGKDYDVELDKLPIKARISAMKVILKINKAKAGTAKEGKVPKGTPVKPVQVNGVNFKELGKKY